MSDQIPGDEIERDEESAWRYSDKLTRRRLLQVGAAAAATGPLIFTTEDTWAGELLKNAGKSNLPYRANRSVKGTITFWHHWASPLRHGTIRQIIRLFNRYYPHVTIKDTAFAFGDNWTKTLAAVAAGKGMPDVEVSNRPTLFWDAGRNKMYESLDDLVRRDHISGKPFFPFTWREATKGGHVWGIPYETDVRMLFWNRARFKDAGLNPNKPPTTWAQLQAYADKLDQKGGPYNGWSVLGFALYKIGNGANLDTLVWDNGGGWENKKQRPTFLNGRNIETANWEKGWVDRYGGPNTLTLLNTKNTDSAHDPFGNQLVDMYINIPGQQAVLKYYGVKFLPKSGKFIFPYWGMGLLPYNSAHKGNKPYSFSGGFSLSMPRNRRRSKATRDASWEMIKFFTLVGQKYWAEQTAAIPTVQRIAKNDPALLSQDWWPNVLRALKYGHAGESNKWDPNFPGDVVVPATDEIMNGSKSARDALSAAQAQALQNMKKYGGP